MIMVIMHNNGNNYDNVRFLMTKTLIIMRMEKLVILTIITVKMLTYRWSSIEKKEQTNLTRNDISE